jgi:plastocyanin
MIDQAICGHQVADESLMVDQAGGVAHAVAILAGVTAGSSTGPAVVNHECRFVPHVQVAAPGAKLTVTSDDKTLHTTHAYAEDGRSLFNIAIPFPGLTITRPIERAKVVRLACDTHPWMRGFIVVTGERAVVTGSDGRFQFDEVPAGTYEIRVWHERLTSPAQKVSVTSGGTAEVTFAAR